MFTLIHGKVIGIKKASVFSLFLLFVISCSDEHSIEKATGDSKSLVVQKCSYDKSYVDKHTEDYIDATHIFIAAQQRQSNLQGLSKVQNFSSYEDVYQQFAYYHEIAGHIVNSETCNHQTQALKQAINTTNAFIRREKSKIGF